MRAKLFKILHILAKTILIKIHIPQTAVKTNSKAKSWFRC
jgi:hypothetical protein